MPTVYALSDRGEKYLERDQEQREAEAERSLELRILYALSISDFSGVAFAELARKTGLPESKVKNAVRKAREKGFITRIRRR